MALGHRDGPLFWKCLGPCLSALDMGPYLGNAYGLTQEGEGTGVGAGSVVPGKEDHKKIPRSAKEIVCGSFVCA